VQVTRRTGRAVTMWLRYAAAAVALAAVLGGMSPVPAAAAEASTWQLRRLTASSEDSEVTYCVVARYNSRNQCRSPKVSKALSAAGSRQVQACQSRSTPCRLVGRCSPLQFRKMCRRFASSCTGGSHREVPQAVCCWQGAVRGAGEVHETLSAGARDMFVHCVHVAVV
jgi:hypothetical protein